jgi:hypothetical protein
MTEPTAKYCGGCDQTKPLDDFQSDSSKRDGKNSRCRTCVSKKGKRYRAANRESILESGRRYREANRDDLREQDRARHAAEPEKYRARYDDWHESLRDKVFGHYGRQCACCGSTEQLAIDHVNGGGGRHRAEVGPTSDRIYYWLVTNGFPSGFQTLCKSCNSSKGNGESCRLNHAAA